MYTPSAIEMVIFYNVYIRPVAVNRVIDSDTLLWILTSSS